MTHTVARSHCGGFALLITLLLLSLLTLAVFALTALVKVNGEISSTSARQIQARQNALLGLNVGLNELQRAAGPDDAVTAMAGISGIAAGSAHSMRHWCGVWSAPGNFHGWLTSGAQASSAAALLPGIGVIELVGSGSVGAASVDSEHVIAAKIPIVVPQLAGSGLEPATIGSYGYWVGDEGVKVSVWAPAAPVSLLLPGSPSNSAPAKLQSAISAYRSKLPGILSYEQLPLLPTPAAALTASVIGDSFHHATLTSSSVSAAGSTQIGLINLNTTSAVVWRGILETYNAAPANVAPLSSTQLGKAAHALANGMAPSASGKGQNGPYFSVPAFLASSLLESALAGEGGVTPAEFRRVMEPALAVRSDTFRIRAYGEATNPFRAGEIQARAYCEAMVQRTPDLLSPPLGRRFRITSFRWLLPTDI